MSRTPASLRTALGAAALGTALLLSGCFGSVAPVATPTPKPEPDFGSIGGDTPVPIDTGTPIEQGDTVDGFINAFDDLGVVAVTVPADWTDQDGEGFTTDAGQDWAYVSASPDLNDYFSSWGTSGVEVAATAISGVDAATLDGQLANLLANISGGYAECGAVTQDAAPYDDGYFVGYESLYAECGPDETVAFAITASSKDSKQVMFVRGQITQDYDVQKVYEAIIGSFDTSIGRSAGGKG